MGAKLSKFKVGLIIFILLAVFSLVYSPHYNYKYPLHADEWVRLTYAKTIEQEDISFGKLRYEAGFVYFLNFLDKFADLLKFYRFLPAIFAVLTCFCLFLFIYYTSKNYYLSILSMIFYASLKSNVNILGNWFFVPLTMASPFIFLYSLFFIRAFRERKFYNLIIAFFILILITLIHPMTVFFLLIISFIYFVINFKNLDKVLVKKIIMLGMTGIIFGILLIIFLNIPLSELHFKVWTKPSINYSLAYIYGLAPLLFAFLGFGYLACKKKNIYMVAWFIFGMFSFYFYKIFRFMFFVSYERGIFYFLLGLPILTAYGFGFFNFLLKKKNIKLRKLIFVVVLIIALISAFYNYHSFHTHKYYEFNGKAMGLEIYYCISNEENFTTEVKRCMYPNMHKYARYIKTS